MILIKKSDKIKNVSIEWQKTYYKNGKWNYGNDKKLIHEKLLTEKNLSEKKIAEIIGNNSWTLNECDECKNDCEYTFQLGQELDYESRTAFICSDCLKKALELIS